MRDSRKLVDVPGALRTLAADASAVVMEANFRPRSQYQRDGPIGTGALVTVDTTVTVDVNVVASAVRDCG